MQFDLMSMPQLFASFHLNRIIANFSTMNLRAARIPRKNILFNRIFKHFRPEWLIHVELLIHFLIFFPFDLGGTRVQPLNQLPNGELLVNGTRLPALPVTFLAFLAFGGTNLKIIIHELC